MSSYNFLVVDDSPTMRQLITFALKRIHNSQVTEANDGVDALKKLSGNKFNLILLDINMPLMDGLKLLSILRGNPSYNDVPIIIITTEGADVDREKALKLGANAYVTKPIQTNELLRVVKEFLKINE
ncbi:MAG: two-component system response regulator [Nitrospirae bacterium RBG_19FT_COMBO_42_15]|nr:MAG: two-component system response regulator [Nitrospirae bacterium RBG_19FT_COMBO_42_15]